MSGNRYDGMRSEQGGNQLYTFESDTVVDILALLAEQLRQRRLERGLSRQALSMMSGVPAPTIAKFEQRHAISLAAFVAMAKALGYTPAIKTLLSEPIYTTMDELDTINRNKHRQRGRNVFSSEH